MKSQSIDLAYICIQHCKAQRRGELLAATPRGLEQEVECKTSDRAVTLETAAHAVEAEIAQRTTCQYQASAGCEPDDAAVHQHCISGAHLDADVHVVAILSGRYSSEHAGKAEVVIG